MNNPAVIAVDPHPDDMYGWSKQSAVSVAKGKDEDKFKAVHIEKA